MTILPPGRLGHGNHMHPRSSVDAGPNFDRLDGTGLRFGRAGPHQRSHQYHWDKRRFVRHDISPLAELRPNAICAALKITLCVSTRAKTYVRDTFSSDTTRKSRAETESPTPPPESNLLAHVSRDRDN
jgi:hypothetical protein